MIALVVIAVLLVQLRPVELRISRKVNPRQVHAGETRSGRAAATNRARLRSPALELHDPVSGTPGTRVELGPLHVEVAPAPRTGCRARQRGQLAIGPLELTRTDVLGLSPPERSSPRRSPTSRSCRAGTGWGFPARAATTVR